MDWGESGFTGARGGRLGIFTTAAAFDWTIPFVIPKDNSIRKYFRARAWVSAEHSIARLACHCCTTGTVIEATGMEPIQRRMCFSIIEL
jgi:hypothetical protein